MKRQRNQKKLTLDHAAIQELKDPDFARIDGGVLSDSLINSPLSLKPAQPNC